jgi:hypothetical protein
MDGLSASGDPIIRIEFILQGPSKKKPTKGKRKAANDDDYLDDRDDRGSITVRRCPDKNAKKAKTSAYVIGKFVSRSDIFSVGLTLIHSWTFVFQYSSDQ